MIGGFKRKKINDESEGANPGGGGDGDVPTVGENIQAVFMGVDHVCTSLATPQVLWGKERGTCTLFPRVSSLENSSAPPRHGSLPLYVSLFLKFSSSSLPLSWAALNLCCCVVCLVVESEGYFSLQCTGFSLWWLLSLRAQALDTQASVAAARGLQQSMVLLNQGQQLDFSQAGCPLPDYTLPMSAASGACRHGSLLHSACLIPPAGL